jgi:hypothetical protein
MVKLLQFLSLFFELLSDHRVVFYHFRLEVFSVSQGLLDLAMETCLVLDAFAAVCHKFFSELLYLISFLLQLSDSFALDFYHLFEVVAFEHKVGNGFFIMGFVYSANFDEHVESFVLKQRKCVLVLHFFYLFLNLCDFGTFLLHFLLIFELALIVVLNNLQFFQSFRQNFVFVEI